MLCALIRAGFRMSHPGFQLTVFGATSFVGQILTRYLFQRHGVGQTLRWAIAGRSENKLKAVRAALGAGAESLPLVLADAADEIALRALCANTQVVVSTVGPYALYGSPLVKVCAETGTDYCDLTGEVQWIARMIEAHEKTAQRSGARIVHCSGFDSIPSDLGTYFLQQEAMKRFGVACQRVKLRVRRMRGGMSGGTVASLMNLAREITQDPRVRTSIANPFALCADQGAGRPRQPSVKVATYDAEIGSWAAPFIMEAVNTRVVHRSNALAGNPYGQDFVYDEAMLTGKGLKGRALATAVSAGLGGFLLGAALPPSRWALERFVVPKPGEGPTVQEQEQGFFDMRLYGKTAAGQSLTVKVTGDRDPGYGSTGKMLGEAAVCLAMDIPKTAQAGGFWTPATVYGDRLIQRLTEYAGLRFEVLS